MDVVLVAHEVFHAFQRMSDPNRDKEFTTIQMEREAIAASFNVRLQAFHEQPPRDIAPIFAGTATSRGYLVGGNATLITKIQYSLACDGERQGGNLVKAFTVDLAFRIKSIHNLLLPNQQLLPIVQSPP